MQTQMKKTEENKNNNNNNHHLNGVETSVCTKHLRFNLSINDTANKNLWIANKKCHYKLPIVSFRLQQTNFNSMITC